MIIGRMDSEHFSWLTVADTAQEAERQIYRAFVERSTAAGGTPPATLEEFLELYSVNVDDLNTGDVLQDDTVIPPPEFEAVIEFDEDDYGDDKLHLTLSLMCPICEGLDAIVEEDTAVRWNDLAPEIDDSGPFANAALGESHVFENSGWLCTACGGRLSGPDWFEINDWS